MCHNKLANERTLLAWVRTSLTFLTLGIGFMQFFRLEQKSQCTEISMQIPPSSPSSLFDHDVTSTILQLCRPIGIMCILMGLLTGGFGVVRFFSVQHMLTKDQFPVTRVTVVVLMVINLSILILLLVLCFKVSL
ncbi:DUF202 domain-containing protein [Acetobacter pasteurianus]|nr:DUF202 domain-containing protein [Acetobacter pasteurianus]